MPHSLLHIYINSFSFKKGLPKDETEHGGGFIFDCRWIDNPGRIDSYKKLTGKDQAVQQFLLSKTEMPFFLTQTQGLLKPVIDKYIQRDFAYLAIHFGCTGGQHRSVFAAIATQQFIQTHFPDITIHINHREQSAW